MFNKILDRPSLPALLLRVGLAFVFAYAAFSSLANPNDWVGYLPKMLTNHVSAMLLLKVFSVYEVFIAVWLLSGVYVRYCALLCTATLAGITLSSLGVFIVTFRDVGLVFTALALAALPGQD